MNGSSPLGGEIHGEVHGHSTRRLEFLTHWSSRNRTQSWDSAIYHRPLSQLPTSHNYSLPLKGLYPLPLKQHHWLRATHELGEGVRGICFSFKSQYAGSALVSPVQRLSGFPRCLVVVQLAMRGGGWDIISPSLGCPGNRSHRQDNFFSKLAG